MKSKVSIYCVTYNHTSFIKKALDSFIAQKTDFPFEIIIGDDCSTDGTRDIIYKYTKDYPDIIKPIYHTNNVGSYQNVLDVANACTGKYVAMCDGDDYWIDEKKLQKQVNFMDNNPEYSICFHPVSIQYEYGIQKNVKFPKARHRFFKNTLSINDLLKYNFIQTSSVMYRWIFNEKNRLETTLPKDILPVDYYLHLLHAEKGNIGFIPDTMAVYRRHTNSLWYGVNSTDEWFLQYGIKHLNFYNAIEKNFGTSKYKEKVEMARNITLAALRNGNKDIINELQKLYPKTLKLAFTEKMSITSIIKHNMEKARKKFCTFIPFVIN